MERRTFIQRMVYTILVLFFGPGVIDQLDVAQTEKLVDELDARLLYDRMSREDLMQAFMHLMAEQIAYNLDEVFMSVDETEAMGQLWLDTEG